MRSELFEETLKQHKDSLTDELEQLGKHGQAQLAKWDIEQNESDYEFYFNAGWNAQQSKVDELQKKNAWLSDVAERENKRANKLQEEKVSTTTLLGKTIQEKNELQRRNQMLNDNIKEQGQKLFYQNEVIETQAEKLLGLRDEKVGLQKRLDAALEFVKQGVKKQGIGKQCSDYYLEKVGELLESGGC